MGYSAATPIKNIKLRDEMIDFLNKNLRQWTDIDPRYKHNPYDGPHTDGSLHYDRGKCRIGFNFSVSHDYVYTMLRWIALKVGKKKAFKKQNLPSCLYIVYDGFEAWPVIPQGYLSVNQEQEWCVVDSFGIVSQDTDPNSYQARMREIDLKCLGYDPWDIIRVEMKRLDELWEKRNELSTKTD